MTPYIQEKQKNLQEEKILETFELVYYPPSDSKNIVKGENDLTPEELKAISGNKMKIGQPEFWNLKQLLGIKEEKIPPDIQLLMSNYDFILIQSNFSMMQGINSSYKWARFSMKMNPHPIIDGLVTYDIYPNRIMDEVDVKQTIGVDLTLKFVEIAEPKIGYNHEVTAKKFLSRITAGGIGTDESLWDFKGNAINDLSGWSALYTIVKVPNGISEITLTYQAYAEISTTWGNIIPLRRSKDVVSKNTVISLTALRSNTET